MKPKSQINMKRVLLRVSFMYIYTCSCLITCRNCRCDLIFLRLYASFLLCKTKSSVGEDWYGRTKNHNVKMVNIIDVFPFIF